MKGMLTILIASFLSLVITEWRIEEYRHFIYGHAISLGTAEGTRIYEKRYVSDEKLMTKKRKVRDREILKYLMKLEEMMNETK